MFMALLQHRLYPIWLNVETHVSEVLKLIIQNTFLLKMVASAAEKPYLNPGSGNSGFRLERKHRSPRTFPNIRKKL